MPSFLGTIRQVPPMYSAIQVEGQRLYDLARKGKTVEVPVRAVTIHQLQIQRWQAGAQPELTLDIDCGPGTYIRSLARDLGEAVGTGATLAQLTRTHSSGFDLASSLTLEALEQAINEETFVPLGVDKAISHLAAIALVPPLARRWRMGQKLAIPASTLSAPNEPTPEISGPGTQFARNRPSSLANTIGPPIRVIEADTQQFLGIGEVRWVPPVGASPTSDPCKEAPALASTQQPTQKDDLATERLKLSPILAAKRVYLAID